MNHSRSFSGRAPLAQSTLPAKPEADKLSAEAQRWSLRWRQSLLSQSERSPHSPRKVATRKEVFILATSADFGSYRQVAEDAGLTLGAPWPLIC
jgi:hypothetical protein